jgi:hypothetical protein
MTTPTSKEWTELADEFHIMVGQCIGAWAQVDDELFRIFQDCVGPLEQCAIIYYRTPGLDVRFGLTDEIVRSVLPKKEKADGGHDHPDLVAWNKAKKGFSDLLGVRRRIAHQPIDIKHGITFGGVTLPTRFPGGMLAESWFEIYVGQHERLREKEAKVLPLKIGDLKDHLSATLNLRARLYAFFHQTLTKPHEASPPPVPPPDPAKSPSADDAIEPQPPPRSSPG